MVRQLHRIVLAMVLLTSSVSADIASGPKILPKPPVVAPLKVVEDGAAGSPHRIVIPKTVLKELLEKQESVPSAGISTFSILIALIALTIAAVSVLLTRTPNPNRKAVSTLLVVASVALGAVVMINRDWNFAEEPSSDGSDRKHLEFDLQDEGHEVILHVPRTTANPDGSER